MPLVQDQSIDLVTCSPIFDILIYNVVLYQGSKQSKPYVHIPVNYIQTYYHLFTTHSVKIAPLYVTMRQNKQTLSVYIAV